MARFWSWWTIAGTVGFVGAFFVVFMVVGALTGDDGPEAYGIPFEVAFPVIIGLSATAMGLVQWRILRRHTTVSAHWATATGLAMLGSFAILMGLIAITGEPATIAGTVVSGGVHGLIVGGAVGTAQWLSIRELDPRRSWILVNVVALAVAAAAGDSVGLYTDGGTATMVTIFLWLLLTAPFLYLVTARVSGAETLTPARVSPGSNETAPS